MVQRQDGVCRAVAATLNDVGPGLGQDGATESFDIVNPFNARC
jgi:hypothetical protein